jgi:hypothetical protein
LKYLSKQALNAVDPLQKTSSSLHCQLNNFPHHHSTFNQCLFPTDNPTSHFPASTNFPLFSNIDRKTATELSQAKFSVLVRAPPLKDQ